MTNVELAQKLAEMTRTMEEARAKRNANVKKIYHQTDPEGWENLKRVLNYAEPTITQ